MKPFQLGPGDFLANGIDATTGSYPEPPLTAAEVASRARQAEPPEVGDGRALMPGTNVDALSSAGWGVVFGEDVEPEVREAMRDLLDLRRNQVGCASPRYREMDYFDGESATDFLDRHGAAPGVVDSENVPYYLLLVGSPESIPWDVHFDLDVGYAVGRIDFPSVGDYRRYAKSTTQAREAKGSRGQRAVFFGVDHDPLTALFDRHLTANLVERAEAHHPNWDIQAHRGESATKTQLRRLLGGPETPAFLFTASHAVSFGPDSEAQRAKHGGLLCQDWPGLETIPTRDHYFTANDIDASADLSGLISFHLACNSAGTPRLDAFPKTWSERRLLAKEAFVSRLPQRLLSHARGGALAVVGHVERAWEICFLWHSWKDRSRTEPKPDLTTFTAFLGELLRGRRVGSAMEAFGQRHSDLAARLVAMLEKEKFGQKADDEELARLWLATRDARGYVVIGDPAVRLSRPLATEE